MFSRMQKGYEKKPCPICGGESVPTWRGSRFRGCLQCGVYFRHPLPTLSELERLYARAYQDPQAHSSETGGTSSGVAAWYVEKLVGFLGEDFGVGPVLDLGAGQGAMARCLQGRGREVVCVDPFSARLLSEQGFEAYESPLEIPDSTAFAGVICSEVVEHLVDPVGGVAAAVSRCAPSAWIFATTPNRRGLRARLQRSRWREATKDGHLFLHSRKSFESLLLLSGCRDVEIVAWTAGRSEGLRRSRDRLLTRMHLDGSVKAVARAGGPPSSSPSAKTG